MTELTIIFVTETEYAIEIQKLGWNAFLENKKIHKNQSTNFMRICLLIF